MQICAQFPSITPLSIREQDADEVMNLFCRYIALAKRKNGEKYGAGNTRRGIKQEVTTRSGQRYIINRYEDHSGLTFGG